jgi:hypothetical protein
MTGDFDNLSSSSVGMLALESLGRRVSEERPQFKFARNPNYGDDVKWLMTISRKLGNIVYIRIFILLKKVQAFNTYFFFQGCLICILS